MQLIHNLLYTATLAAAALPSNATLSDSALSLYNATPSLWDTVQQSPNASAMVDLGYFDLTKPYLGETVDTWKLSLSIKSDLPYKNFEKPDSFTGSVLQIIPPEGMFNKDNTMGKADPTWSVFALTWRFRPNSTVKETDGRVDCRSLVSPNCLGAMGSLPANLTDASYANLYKEFCRDEQEHMRFEGQGPVPGKGLDLSYLLLVDKAPPAKAPIDEYDQAIRDIYIVGTRFFNSGHKPGDHSNYTFSVTDVIRCIRATDFHGGSRTRDGETSAATSLVPGLWVVTVAAIAVFL
ncbi:hypothetical protein VHEMI10248 [[Torrubiella] hemipterigena]|uniref:Uncharacterized protein n=1 Tax=[Torrubiella] hemipterigena TaxID=1531966 RepID=A0A0A1TT07_9HYPO|nr:hypothetical protein VHEMI10248 [[Torrubiella] hemipterigena]